MGNRKEKKYLAPSVAVELIIKPRYWVKLDGLLGHVALKDADLAGDVSLVKVIQAVQPG